MRRLFFVALAVVLGAVYVQIVLEGPVEPVEAPGHASRPAGDLSAVRPPEASPLRPDPEAERLLPAWEDPWPPGLQPQPDPVADSLLEDAARAAWAFIDRNYEPTTGLVRAHDEYRFVTMWDVASALAAYHAAPRLGLTSPEDARNRAARALRTLGTLRLFEDRLFNKVYDAETGQPVDALAEPSEGGYGWSAIDLGRLLVWLRILRDSDPDLAPLADAVVRRLDPALAVRDGYLMGREKAPIRGVRSYQEGRVGYEQYAARGFALWGVRASRAEDPWGNAVIDSAFGRPVPRDVRGADCLTSEPIVLAGLEVGWDASWEELARSTLEAQFARYQATDTLTIVSEDASSREPHYFYYYCATSEGRAFVVRAKGDGEPLDGPRAVSTKAALAWYALAPSSYTAEAVRAVAAAAGPDGWPAGVMEGSAIPSGGENVNTAGVVLEAALYARTGQPLLAARAPRIP